MSEVENFLTAQEEEQVIAAIKSAEKNTSGEIRVHIEKLTKTLPLERAKEVFWHLKMNETKLQNGVLFYVAVESKKFAIYGDRGIYNQTTSDFWNDEKELVINHFSKKQNVKGLVLAIEKVGEKLKKLFPYTSDDANELSNEISKG
ncbi:MAG: TPM domain-containing protein [Flavobacteriaceae bacterium]|nr:TPM domain-containing protein [Flavobacteriaceae bacterium]